MAKKKTLKVDPDARQKIIAVATKLFGEKGLDGTSTRDIAKASGLNISLISYYFGGKTGLYKTIIYEHAVSMKEKIDGIVHTYSQKELTVDSFVQEVNSIIRNFVEMRMQSESIAKIFMSERGQGMPHCREVFENLMAPTVHKLVAMIKEGQKKGFLRNDFPPQVFLVVMIESIFAYFQVYECHLKIWSDTYKMPKDKEKLISFLTQTFTRGILI
jgi:AcrR family transcriptional regulator